MNTSNLTDKIFILACCLILYFCQTDFDINVVILLVSISFSAFISYFEYPKIKAILTVCFSVLSLFIHPLNIFMPLIAYDMVYGKYRMSSLMGIVALANFAYETSSLTISAVTGVLILSVLIRYRTETQIKLHQKCNRLSDVTREMSLLLDKQKRDLMEQQDNELHIATLNERNRIAREIHDNVGHLLTSSILQSAALQTVTNDRMVKESLKTINETLSQAMNNVRQSVHDLYDQSIDLNMQMEEVLSQFKFCEVGYDYSITGNPDKKLKYAFISIVKEALANVMKHSNATLVNITFREHPALYQLIIKDNGRVKSYRTDEGLGLKNMMDRVRSFNGHMNISIENGFEIFISVPKEQNT